MSLAFTSLGVTEDRLVNCRGGWVFRISGELCHLVGSLRPDEGVPPAYAQLYIYDSHLALHQRMSRNSNLREDTMRSLQSMLLDTHRYSHDFKHAYEILQDYPDAPNAEVRLRVLPHPTSRAYDIPTSDEVAVILPGDGSAPERRDIILRSRTTKGEELARIDDGHPAYAPLHYVLLFPYGTNGWHRDLVHRIPPGVLVPPDWVAPRISQTQYSSFRLHSHQNEYATLHRCGRLFQQYIVDMWASADQTRLSFLRFNQGKLRATLYSGLEDCLRADEIVDPHDLGRRTVLPTSYIGGPRNMQQRYQDAMAVARHYHNVDLFITMTTNPDWVEIKCELPGQTAYDRPDLVARVFKLKKDELLKDIYKRRVIGSVAAYVYVIEFQKRGLPHCHILVIFDSSDRLRSPADIDACISVQWPDPQKAPQLFETVKSCMVHGPCGNINPNSPCMRDGKCMKGYPKPFQHVTTFSDNGYPLYSRPDDGRLFPIRMRHTTFEADNRWIVPYNPYLSAKYNCHINVESVASFKTLKYCFKYVHKGPDRAAIEYSIDEIKTYIDGRYIGAPEAIWRIFHFPIHEQLPPVVRLQVSYPFISYSPHATVAYMYISQIHLPGQHMVVFDPDEPIETIVARAAAEVTTLTAYFHVNNSVGPDGDLARSLTYQDFPQKFVWTRSEKTWTVRKQGFSIGRMYFVPPTAGERFYLRTLLTIVQGPKSFKDLRTYDSVVYPTFQDACKARGLLEDDGEWHLCLSDASHMQPGKQLRHLFASMLLFCQISSPETLWTEFRDSICDDLHIRIPNATPHRIFDYGLFLIDRILSDSGCTLLNFPHMPLPQENWAGLTSNRFIVEQLSYNAVEEQDLFRQHLENVERVAEQLDAYNRIVQSLDSGDSATYFLNGAGGTGKTYLYRTLCHKLRSEGKIVLCVASSGVAALLLPDGHTAHSTFRIPINDLDANSLCNISKEDLRADLLRKVDLMIWDEALMQNRFTHEAVDRTLRDICDDERLFGGKTVIFGGDVQQTLPVIPGGSREDIIFASLPHSYLWPSLQLLNLRINLRLLNNHLSDDFRTEEQAFADWLLSVGRGDNVAEDGTIAFEPHMRVPDVECLITSIYPHIEDAVPPPMYFLDRVILAPRNTDVNQLNMDILNRMPGSAKVFHSADSIESTDTHEDNAVPVEFLRSIETPGLPPGELHLKPGCPLILLRNLAPTRGLCNGTRMIFKRATGRVLEVEILGGKHHGE